MLFFRPHRPLFFSWPWPTTEDDEGWLCGETKSGSGNQSRPRGESTLTEEVDGVETYREEVERGIAHHKKRRRRMAPVLSSSRMQLHGRQAPTPELPISISLSLSRPTPSLPSPSASDGGAGGLSSSSLILSSSVPSSVSVSSSSRSSSITSSPPSSILTSSSAVSASLSSSSSSPSSLPSASSTVSLPSSSLSSTLSSISPNPSESPPTSSYEWPPISSEPTITSIPLTTFSSSYAQEPYQPPYSIISSSSPFTSLPQTTIPLLTIESSSVYLAPITTIVLASSTESFSSFSASSSISPTPSVLPQDLTDSLARNTGAIVGISIAAFVVLLALVLCLFFAIRSKRRQNESPYLRSDNEHGHAGGRISALRNLLGASPSLGRSTASSLDSSIAQGALAYGGSSREGRLAKGRPVMATTISRGSGISLGSQFSLEEDPIEGRGSGSRPSLTGGADGKASVGLGMGIGAGMGMGSHWGEMTQSGGGIPLAPMPGAAAVGSGVIMGGAGIGIALTTRDSQFSFGFNGPESTTTTPGLGRSVSGRAPILYRPPSAPGIPPSSYHWKATSPSIPLPVSPSPPPPTSYPGGITPQPTRISPIPNSSNHSQESAVSPSSEAAGVINGYYALASSSGHGPGMASSSDIPSDVSSEGVGGRTSRNKPNRPNSFAAAFTNLGKSKSSAGHESQASSSSDVNLPGKSWKGKDKEAPEFDFGFLGRLKNGSGKGKRISSSSFGRSFGKNPVHVGMPLSGMSFTTSTLDSDRLAADDYPGELGTRVRPSSLLNPPNPSPAPSPMEASFPSSHIVPPSQSLSSSTSEPGMRRLSLPSMALVPATPPQDLPPPPPAALPSTSIKPPFATNGSSVSLPTTRAKRGRSQLYISNDTRWADSIVDSFYGCDSVDDHDQPQNHNPALDHHQELTVPPHSSSRVPSPYSPLSQYSQPSASHHPHGSGAGGFDPPPHSAPFARPVLPQLNHAPDRTSFASVGSNGTDSSANSRPGVPEGLLRSDLRAFVLGLRSQETAAIRLRDVYGDETTSGEYREHPWDERRRDWDWDGQSIGSLRDHVDYSRPIGTLVNQRMPSTTTFNSDHDP